jgi:hypothetical protein
MDENTEKNCKEAQFNDYILSPLSKSWLETNVLPKIKKDFKNEFPKKRFK